MTTSCDLHFSETGGFKKFLIACFNPLFKMMIGKQMKMLRELAEGQGSSTR